MGNILRKSGMNKKLSSYMINRNYRQTAIDLLYLLACYCKVFV
jgi:hypothetical protein